MGGITPNALAAAVQAVADEYRRRNPASAATGGGQGLRGDTPFTTRSTDDGGGGCGAEPAFRRNRDAIGLLGNVPFASTDGVVPLQRSDMTHLQFRGHDEVPDRSNVVFLCGVAPGTAVRAVAERFTAAGLGVPLQIIWVGRGSLRVVMAKETSEKKSSSSSRGEAVVQHAPATVRERLEAIGMAVEVLTYEGWKERHTAEVRSTAAATAGGGGGGGRAKIGNLIINGVDSVVAGDGGGRRRGILGSIGAAVFGRGKRTAGDSSGDGDGDGDGYGREAADAGKRKRNGAVEKEDLSSFDRFKRMRDGATRNNSGEVDDKKMNNGCVMM